MKTREERKLCRGRYLRVGLIFGLLLFLCFQLPSWVEAILI